MFSLVKFNRGEFATTKSKNVKRAHEDTCSIKNKGAFYGGIIIATSGK